VVTGTFHTMGGENLSEIRLEDCELPPENLILCEDGFRKLEDWRIRFPALTRWRGGMKHAQPRRSATVTAADVPRLVGFGRAICGDLHAAEHREWWLANGLGGYAAGTIAGTLTRRYHGLLIAPVEPPLGQRLVWAKADAELVGDNAHWPLFTNRWASGAISPAGHIHLESFHLDGLVPVWVFAIGLTRSCCCGRLRPTR
jgi:glycogen debranching enzyme-like protein